MTLLDDVRPALEIEYFEVVPARPPMRTAPPPRVTPPLVALYEELRAKYELAIGEYCGLEPRRHSIVEHHLATNALDVVHRLGLRSATYDGMTHEYRVPTNLDVAWSWPHLPVWLTVAERSSTSSTLRLSLRTKRRLRYPKRYFHSAHAFLEDLESAVTTVGARSG